MLGGSSSINAMIYIRGNRADYDEWAAGGAEGWGYEDVLPLLPRAEDNERGESDFHGVGGPLSVRTRGSPTRSSTRSSSAAVEAGMPANDDFNGEMQDGVGRYQVTQRDGHALQRRGRLPAARRWTRPNLDVITGALAPRGSCSRATAPSAWRSATVTTCSEGVPPSAR